MCITKKTRGFGALNVRSQENYSFFGLLRGPNEGQLSLEFVYLIPCQGGDFR